MTTQQQAPCTPTELLPEQVKAYLQQHPSFFEDHPELLEMISLPHESGAAISLIERQVSVLRERNLEMRQRLNGVLDSAKVNDKLFEKTKRLILTLLETGNKADVLDAVSTSLDTDFQVEFHSLILIGDHPLKLRSAHTRIVSQDEANRHIGTLLRNNRAICGILGTEELAFLFGDDANRVGSVAAVPLTQGSAFGILAIGNSDPNFYRSSMGTLFLSYIAEVLSRIIPRLDN
ncbi:DUF484 family protein [Porticoccus sp.]